MKPTALFLVACLLVSPSLHASALQDWRKKIETVQERARTAEKETRRDVKDCVEYIRDRAHLVQREYHSLRVSCRQAIRTARETYEQVSSFLKGKSMGGKS